MRKANKVSMPNCMEKINILQIMMRKPAAKINEHDQIFRDSGGKYINKVSMPNCMEKIRSLQITHAKQQQKSMKMIKSLVIQEESK